MRSVMRGAVAVAILCGTLGTYGVAAQTRTVPKAPPSTGQNLAPTPMPPIDPGLPQSNSGSSAPSSGSSTEQLSRSGGVVRPPETVDPGMNQPAPNPGSRSMPVIPPPGTPGGDPSITPK